MMSANDELSIAHKTRSESLCAFTKEKIINNQLFRYNFKVGLYSVRLK